MPTSFLLSLVRDSLSSDKSLSMLMNFSDLTPPFEPPLPGQPSYCPAQMSCPTDQQQILLLLWQLQLLSLLQSPDARAAIKCVSSRWDLGILGAFRTRIMPT